MSTFLNPTSNAKTLPIVASTSYLTLHYRLCTQGKQEIISTFNGNPATLMMGTGQLAPALEQRLIGLTEGTHQSFVLPPQEAFGLRNPDLIQSVSSATLQENSALDESYHVGDLVEFNAPTGGRFAGVLRRMDKDAGVFDFNHPLAGQTIIFEVNIIGIL